MYRALEKLRFDIVELLLQHDAQIPYRMNMKTYQVIRTHNAILKGEPSVPVFLYDRLFICSSYPNVANTKTLRLLLNRGLDPNFVEPVSKRTLFMQAVIMNSLEICQVLIEGGADPCKRDSCGLTCLHAAVKHHALETLKLLLEHGAIDINDDCNTSNSTALHMLHCRHPFSDINYRCVCYDITVALVESGASIDNPRGLDGILSMAVSKNRLPVVQYLMSKCDAEKRDERLSMMCRAACTHPKMLDYLLEVLFSPFRMK
jgi:hypothetical protein